MVWIDISTITWVHPGVEPNATIITNGFQPNDQLFSEFINWLVKLHMDEVNNLEWLNDNKVNITRTINTKPLSADIVLAAADFADVVPTSRTINGTALTGNISLTASDVSAVPTSEKGAASGVATLDTTTKIPLAQNTAGLIYYIGNDDGGTIGPTPYETIITNSQVFSKILISCLVSSPNNASGMVSVNGSATQSFSLYDNDRTFIQMEFGANAGVDIELAITSTQTGAVAFIMAQGVI